MAKLTTDLSSDVEALSRAFNLTIGDETYEPDHFGDASLILIGPEVSFRLLRDRAEVFLDVRGVADDWIDVRGILGSLGLLDTPRELHSLGELIAIVSRNAEVFSHSLREDPPPPA